MTTIPVFKPKLPSARDLAPYLSEIDQNHWYTNFGPLVRRFESKLAALTGVKPETVVTSANATLALTQVLLAMTQADPGGEAYCITPSWSFIATPIAIRTAGLQPYFVDVDAPSWAMTPAIAEAAFHKLEKTGRTVAAIMPVCPFGSMPDLPAWENLSRRIGIPVVIDAAASFDAVTRLPRRTDGVIGSVPVVVSLHATKAFGIGEGAFILARDLEMADLFRIWGNFGFCGSRQSLVPGLNAKMPEMAAAVGLALLDQWTEVRDEWATLSRMFRSHANRMSPALSTPLLSDDWISSYGIIQLSDPAPDIRKLQAELTARGIDTRFWWEAGCHTHPSFSYVPCDPLETTMRLASSSIGLPFWRGLSESDVCRIFDGLGEILPALAPHALTGIGNP